MPSRRVLWKEAFPSKLPPAYSNLSYVQGTVAGAVQGVRSGDTVGLFKNILGVYMHLSDEQVPPDIRKWNVKILPLSRNNRHNDVAQVGYFFEELDRFLAGLPAKAKSLAVS